MSAILFQREQKRGHLSEQRKEKNSSGRSGSKSHHCLSVLVSSVREEVLTYAWLSDTRHGYTYTRNAHLARGAMSHHMQFGGVLIGVLAPLLAILGHAGGFSYEDLPAVAMDYKVHIDAGKEDCYFQYVNPGATFYVSFQVGRAYANSRERAMRVSCVNTRGGMCANDIERYRTSWERRSRDIVVHMVSRKVPIWCVWKGARVVAKISRFDIARAVSLDRPAALSRRTMTPVARVTRGREWSWTVVNLLDVRYESRWV